MKSFAAAALIISVARTIIFAEERSHLWDHDFSLKPSILNATDSEQWAGALRWHGSASYDYSPWRGNSTAFVAANTRGTVATDAQAHSENMLFELNAGLAWQLQKPAGIGGDSPSEERDPNAPATNQPASDGFRWGRFELSGKVGFESDQKFDNYAITYGPQVGYFHNNEAALWPLVPSVYLDYQRVELIESSYYQSLGLNDHDSYYRFSAITSWQMPVGNWLAQNNKLIRPLGVVVNLQYSRSYDVPTAVKVQGGDESFYCEAGLNYVLTSLQSKWIQSAYITIANGRIAPATEDKTMVFVGISFGGSTKSKW